MNWKRIWRKYERWQTDIEWTPLNRSAKQKIHSLVEAELIACSCPIGKCLGESIERCWFNWLVRERAKRELQREIK